MSLLDSDEEEFDIKRSSTNDQLFEDTSTDSKHRDKREKKVKSDDRKGSLKNLPWTKPKDGLQEKTPKKSKHNRTKSGSRSPPDSPKVSRAIESKRTTKVTTGQLVPSPNVKGNRKRYSQLEGNSDSSDEEEADDGYLLSNKPVLDEHRHQRTTNRETFDSGFHSGISPTVLSSTTVAGTHPSSPLRKNANSTFLDSPFLVDDPWKSSGTGAVLQPEQVGSAAKLLQPVESNFQSLEDRIFLGGVEHKSPNKQPHSQIEALFTSPMPSQTTKPSMVNPWAVSETLTDWSISDELKQKCSSHFVSLKPSNGLLQGDKAREFFVQSKLPNQELSQIWRLADVDRDNALSMEEFCVAMKLVLMRRKGHEIPSSLPEELQRLHNKDSFSDSFWQTPSEPSHQDADDVIGDFPHSDEAIVAENDSEEVVLVEMNDESDSTGLLVDISESRESAQRMSPTPRVANIISLDEESWTNDDTLLVLTTSADDEPNESLEVKKETKPVRPAPPKPSARRSKSLREGKPVPPAKPLFKKGTTGNLQTPTSTTSGDNEKTPMIIISSQRTKTTQRAVSPPPTSKKSYSVLSDSSNESHDIKSHDTKSHDTNEDERDGKFKWRGFKGQTKGAESPILEGQEKGHSRSTSLDLNKMLLGEAGSTEVLEDMPSATPPKPPPKPYFLANSVASTVKPEVMPRSRVRAASTGSISSPVELSVTSGDEQPVLDTSADALLLSQPQPPPVKMKPTRKAPRRPPPPKNKPESLEMKDKKDVQATIRSLKENNSLLTEVNRSLEEKLFQLQEERIKLARELELAEQKYH